MKKAKIKCTKNQVGNKQSLKLKTAWVFNCMIIEFFFNFIDPLMWFVYVSIATKKCDLFTYLQLPRNVICLCIYTTKKCDLFRYLQQPRKVICLRILQLPRNDPALGLCQGLVKAWQHYGNKKYVYYVTVCNFELLLIRDFMVLWLYWYTDFIY